MYIIIRSHNRRRYAVIVEESEVSKKLLEISNNKPFDTIKCYSMVAYGRESLCASCMR